MDHDDAAHPLKVAIEFARAEEAEALRRTYLLRSDGVEQVAFRRAVCEAVLQHAEVVRLQLELRHCTH